MDWKRRGERGGRVILTGRLGIEEVRHVLDFLPNEFSIL
jgi:hypothetical protein